MLMVRDLHPSRGEFRRFTRDPHRRRQPLVLPHRGLRPSIGPDHPVAHEIAVVRRLAEVAAVGPVGPAVGQGLDQAVVEPLPDEPALEPGSRFDRVPVVGEVAVAVAHRVRELAHDQRMALEAGAGVIDDGRDRRVHRAGDVADALVARPVVADGALVVERPARVVAAQPGGRGVVVEAVARLVAERPEDDRRMVLVALRHPRHAIDPLREIPVVVAQGALEGVRFDVGLADDVHPELVGQGEEGRVVRVVRGAHGVEPELLHQDEVGMHRFDRDDPPGVLVEVVAVDAPQVDPGAVDQQVQALDLDPPEADLGGRLLDDLAIRVAQRDRQRVEVRRLRGPAGDGGEVQVPGDEPVGRRSLAAVDGGPRGLVLGREQAGGLAVHDPLVVEGPAPERLAVDAPGVTAEDGVSATASDRA